MVWCAILYTMALHIVSWNVAAWMPTVEYMRSFATAKKKAPATKGRASPIAPKATPAEAVLHFLRGHNRVDILALQEVKTKDADLADAARAGQLAAHVPGYESFWNATRTRGERSTIGRRKGSTTA